ncbi:MAG: molybdopterin-dependent oxidoreductase [Chromatiales bacterium]|nr:molybdopterin-dependent oxidoreductase [Chromatiales bacterium]
MGDTVALVIARSAHAAREAADLIDVDYAPLPVVVVGDQALAPQAPVIWPDAPNNTALDWSGGDAVATQAQFDKAHHITRLRLVNNRIVVAPMETRGVIADYDAGAGRYTVHTPSQGVNHIRLPLARNGLKTPASKVRVLTGDVGGAFGMKIPVYPEHVLVCWAAKRTGRPVKWISDRVDSFVADGHGRDHVMECELALDENGRFLAVRCLTTSNMGAYANGAAPVIPTAGGTRCITGVYDIAAWHARVKVVFTNTTPVVAYRGAGKPEYNYVIERLIDAAARELNVDPVALRRSNSVTSDAMPFETGTGLTFDTGEFAHNLQVASEIAQLDAFEARRSEATSRGKLLGIGLAQFQEPDGYLDNRVSLTFDPTGELRITITGDDAGQGHQTTFAQVAAAQFSMPMDRIDVSQGDSSLVGPGSGSGGSRTATVASMGIVRAAEQIIEKGRHIAAARFEAAAVDVDFSDGTYAVAGTDKTIAFTDIVRASFDLRSLPPATEPGLSAQCHHLASEYNYPCGVHVCEVEIDPETGDLNLKGYWIVGDHGVLINPMLLEGQVHGGTVQGIGQALFEDVQFDLESGQLLSGSFMDYQLPRAADLVPMDFRHEGVPCKTNPLGVKGVGESGCTASMPAIMNAVVSALSTRGVFHLDMPATPRRIWQALKNASSPS